MPNENQLYAMWCDAGVPERAELERRLHTAIRNHVRAIVRTDLPDSDPHFVDQITDDAIHSFESFRGGSLFSTWVQAITKKKIKMELRARSRRRKVIDETVTLDESPDPEEEEDRSKSAIPVAQRSNVDTNIALDQLAKVLGPQEQRTLSAMREGRDQYEIASEEGITPEAADSRRQRVKRKLAKKVIATRRPGGSSGN